MGTIEVVVLRSAELQRAKVPDPSAKEKHPSAFAFDSDTAQSIVSAKDSLSDLGGLFDGSSDVHGLSFLAMPFGGDMARDDGYGNDRKISSSGDWGRSYADDQQQGTNSAQKNNNSRSSGRSLASDHRGSPAIVINVNQPPAPPSPWALAEPQPESMPKASGVDSWASTPAPGSVHGGDARPDPGVNIDDSWQTWLKDAGKNKARTPRHDRNAEALSNPKNSPQRPSFSSNNDSKNRGGNGGARSGNNNDAWGSSSNRGRNSQTHSVPDGWGQQGDGSNWGAKQTAGQDGNNNWNSKTNNDSYNQNNDSGWNYSANDNGNLNPGWNNNGSGEQQGNGDSGGGNDDQANDAWGDGGNNWSSGQNDQGNWNSNNNQNEGDWNTGQNNDQGHSGWGNYVNGTGNDNQDDTGWKNKNGSGNAWNYANTGAQEPQADNIQNWNTSGDDQDGWGQGGEVNKGEQATAGGLDRSNTKSRRASSGAKPAKSTLSKQASLNSAAQKMGWGPSSVNGVQKPSGPPGAWPETSQNIANSGSLRHEPKAIKKPYHITLDEAGNPRLPDMQPAALAPSPLPAPPVAPVALSFQVSKGEPALYQHKVASPKYIDTHDRPYAVFVFRYRTKSQSSLNRSHWGYH